MRQTGDREGGGRERQREKERRRGSEKRERKQEEARTEGGENDPNPAFASCCRGPLSHQLATTGRLPFPAVGR